MKILKYHYHNVIENDLILTEHIKSSFSLPKLKKIVISAGGGSHTESYVMSSLLILDFISQQKPMITCCNGNNNNNFVVGGKVTLRKSMMFLFLFTLLFEILPSIKSFEGLKYPSHKNTFIFTLKDVFLFKGLSSMVPFLDNSACFVKIQLVTTTKDKYQLFKLGRLFLICFSQ